MQTRLMRRDTAVTAGMLLAAAFCGGALASLLASLLVGAPAGAQGVETVTAAQFNLVDAGGGLRGVLSARDESGQPSLALYDTGGQPRARLGLGPDGNPALELRNAAGEPRFSAGVIRDDTQLLVGDEQQAHGMFGATAGAPLLTFADGRQGRMQLRMGADGRPSVVLVGGDGQRSAALTMDREDSPLLTLYEAGRARVTVGVVQQAAVINLNGPGLSRVVVGVGADGHPSVTFYDDDGMAMGTIP